MRVGILAVLCCFISLHAKEFLYPVGCHPEQDIFFVMYQKTAYHLELWEWNPYTKYAQQLLLSRYSPAGFALLPDRSGFSFIDNGMLKVKQLLKRSPRTIEYDAPIYNVEQVHWIDSHTCYASGRYQDHFGIFQIDWDGFVQPLLVQEGVDYFYPQKIDATLFFIERSHEGTYRFACTSYRVQGSEDEFDDRMILYLEDQPVVQELIATDTPLAFLTMVSEREGFVLSYPQKVLQKNPTVPFEYYRIYQTDRGEWEKSYLFSFSIPTDFLVGPNRLYESILPLLPYSCQDGIYYVDASELSVLALYLFDRSTGTTRRVTQDVNQHLFGVKTVGDSVVYGGEITGDIEMAEGVQMRLGTLAIS